MKERLHALHSDWKAILPKMRQLTYVDAGEVDGGRRVMARRSVCVYKGELHRTNKEQLKSERKRTICAAGRATISISRALARELATLLVRSPAQWKSREFRIKRQKWKD